MRKFRENAVHSRERMDEIHSPGCFRGIICNKKHNSLRQLLDGVIAVFLAVTYKEFISSMKGLGRSLEFIGKHSMNIFLFHTFIYYIYFPDFIYWSRNPILIYMTLLAACLCVSMMIEWLKRTTGFDGSVDRLIRKVAR